MAGMRRDVRKLKWNMTGTNLSKNENRRRKYKFLQFGRLLSQAQCECSRPKDASVPGVHLRKDLAKL